MRAMKDSGVEWIGEIPVEWNVIKLKFLAKIQTGNTPSKVSSDNYSQDGLMWVKPDNLNEFKPITDTKEKISEIGLKGARIAKPYATLMCCIGSVGKFGYSSQDVAYNQQINAIEFDQKLYQWKFGMYYLSTQKDQHQYYMNGNVVYILNSDAHKNIIAPYLDFDEQTRIADYLDAKCAEIDTLIAAKEKTNALLKERRQSIIYEAVTKGLDPNAPMKDSGIEWIGEIPQQWDIVKIKFILDKSEFGIRIGPFGSALTNRTIQNGSINVYSQANLISGDFRSTNNTIDEKSFQELKAYEVKAGDICVSMMGTIGKCMSVPPYINKGIMDSHLIKIRLNDKIIDSKFFEYVYDKDQGGVCFFQMQFEKKGTIMDGLNTTIVRNLVIPFPSLPEQICIADYLDTKCAEIDALISANETTIEKLKEYRQSVIFEAVTGKVEI